jgi:hypothetical protein
VRDTLHQAQIRHDPGHGRRLHPFGFGQLTGRECAREVKTFASRSEAAIRSLDAVRTVMIVSLPNEHS